MTVTVKRMPVAAVKREFKAVLDAAEHGERTVVLRRGKPVAVVVPVEEDVERPALPKPHRPGGLLALSGLFADWESMEEDIAEIIAARQHAVDRPPPEFD